MTNCSVKGCTTTTRHCSKTKNGITLHGFPADPVRNEMWNRIMRKQRGDPCYKYKKFAKVCSLHFTVDSFYVTKKGRVKLKDTALPSLKLKQAVKSNQKQSPQEAKSELKQSPQKAKTNQSRSPQEALSDLIKFPQEVNTNLNQSPQEANIELKVESLDPEDNLLDVDISDLQPKFDTPHEIKLKLQIAKYEERHIKNNKTLKYLRSEIHRLKKRNLSLDAIVKDLRKNCFINRNNETSPAVTPELAEIFKLDVKRRRVKEKHPGKKPRLQFSPALQKFALTLNAISPNAYLYVRRSFNCCLPHPRTLHTWYSSITGERGTRADLTSNPVADSSETVEIVTNDSGLITELTCAVDPHMLTF